MLRSGIAIGAAAALAATLLAVVGLVRGRALLEPVASEPRLQLFEVAPGDSLGRVAQRLEAMGLVRSATATKLFARYEGIASRLQVGEYELSPDQSTGAILDAIVSGRVKTYPVTIPEGIRASEIALRLEAAGLVESGLFLSVVDDPAVARSLGIAGDSLEGYLYPDTYHLPRGLSPREVALTMVKQFEQVWREQLASPAGSSPLSKGEIVTLASIVEKETAAPVERPLIAAVFLNRLEKGMRLETDPTVIYGIEDFDGNIKRRHLEDASNPYNTYRIRGLPPGPIASPGADALLAVVSPSATEYLYFVSMNNGTHHFSTTYREHVKAVNRFQRRRGR
jgi:UPF0755 protein